MSGASNSDRKGTPPERGYTKLVELNFACLARDAILALVRLDELPLDELGETWGVTTFPGDSKTVVLRMNVGTNYVAEVKAPNGEERLAELRIYTASKVAAPFEGSLSGPMNMKTVEWVVTAPLKRAQELIADPAVAESHRSLVNQSRRKLINPGWHNPMLDQLLSPQMV